MDELLFRPEPFQLAAGGCGCARCSHATPELEVEDFLGSLVPQGSAWSQWGVTYVSWLQTALNQARHANLAVTGTPDRKTIAALQALQHRMPGRYQRMGRVGAWTSRALTKLGAPPPPARPAPPAVGIDVNFDTRKHLSCLANAKWLGVKVSYAVRYYSFGYVVSSGNKVWGCDHPNSKNLTPGEAQALTAAGIKIVTVWEAGANATGRKQGTSAARCAARQAIRCGQPAGTPIYFAIDHDPKASERPGMEAYFQGIRDELAKASRSYQIGVYGNRTSLDWCKAQGIATWFWQSCSTLTANGTNQFRWPGVNLHQVKCEQSVCGVHVDWNESDGREGAW